MLPHIRVIMAYAVRPGTRHNDMFIRLSYAARLLILNGLGFTEDWHDGCLFPV